MIHSYSLLPHDIRMSVYQEILNVLNHCMVKCQDEVEKQQRKTVFELQNNTLDISPLKMAEDLAVAVVKRNLMKDIMKHFIDPNSEYITNVSNIKIPDAAFESLFDTLESVICNPNQRPSEMSNTQILESNAKINLIYDIQKLVRRPLDKIAFP
tara:strand:+ start:38469 stop:38930 length:462 start_codon:yes stop_codon:yes gene_type:complete